ncbi:hypothetical protein WJX74_003721 [Apatococcus lobatus]
MRGMLCCCLPCFRSRSAGRPGKQLQANKQATASCEEPLIQKQTGSFTSCQQAQTSPKFPVMASALASSQQQDLSPLLEQLPGASGTMEPPLEPLFGPPLACKDSPTKIRADKMQWALCTFRNGYGPWVHLIGPPDKALLMHNGLPAGFDVHTMYDACSQYQQRKLDAAKCNPEPYKGPKPSDKPVARGIDAIVKLMEPGQQTLQCDLDSCFSKQMLDRKDSPFLRDHR